MASRLSWNNSPATHRINLIDPSVGEPYGDYNERVALIQRQPVYVNSAEDMHEDWCNPVAGLTRLQYEPLLYRIAVYLQDRPYDRVQYKPIEIDLAELLAISTDGGRETPLYPGTIGDGYSIEDARSVLCDPDSRADLQEVHTVATLLDNDRVVLDLMEPPALENGG